VAAIGVQALEAKKNHQPMDREVQSKNLELLKAAEKPQAVVLDMVAPSVVLLVESAGGKQ
jgi:hypothetical protein